MTKTNIMKVINKANTNKNIRWSILEATDTMIILTNDYDKCVKFKIVVKNVEGEAYIEAKDQHMGTTVCLLLYGDRGWCDYTETEQGITLAIEQVVEHFNHTY